MKKSTIVLLISILCLFNYNYVNAQCNAWTQKADFPMARSNATGFSIGDKGYIGTGWDGTARKDFWEYDPSTNIWTQKADFGGTPRDGAFGLAIGNKGYMGTGYDGTYRKDFWEYDTSGNTWTQKTDFGGTALSDAAGFSIGNKGYIGTGWSGIDHKEFWEYDPSGDNWTQKADFGGNARDEAVGFSIGGKGYIGTGWDTTSYYSDFWEYDPGTNLWTEKANFGGTPRAATVGFSINDRGYIGTGYGGGYTNDFWEYDPGTDNWLQKASFGGTARYRSAGFSVDGKGYIGTGWTGGFELDFWEYIPLPNINSEVSTNESCSVGNDGTITISASGNGTLSFSIDGGTTFPNTTGMFTGLSSGTYTVVVQDQFGCQQTGSTITISQLASTITITSETSTNTSCSSGDDGTITILATGGSGTLSYSIDSGATFPNTTGMFTGLVGGSYTIVVQDTMGCIQTGSTLTITGSSGITITSEASTNASCTGDIDGTITIVASGGAGTLSYSIDGGATFPNTTGIFIGLSSGSYDIVVQDIIPCNLAGSTITIIDPLQVTMSFVTTNVSCIGDNDGKITITGSGGTGTLSYSIDGGGTFPNTTGIFINLSLGNYTLAMQDANGCTISGTIITIADPLPITISSEVSTDVSCVGGTDGTITIIASGGTGALSYSVDGGTTFPNSTGSITGLGTGSYSIVVQDANGCTLTGSTLTIIETAPAINILLETTTDVTVCGGTDGTITIVANGGTPPLSYSIDGGTTFPNTTGVFTGLSLGDYNVVVNDTNGCTQLGSILTIYEPTSIIISSEVATDETSCGAADGTIIITATDSTATTLSYSIDGGLTYPNTTGIFTGLTSGTFKVWVKNTTDNCIQIGSTLNLNDPSTVAGVMSSTPDTNVPGMVRQLSQQAVAILHILTLGPMEAMR